MVAIEQTSDTSLYSPLFCRKTPFGEQEIEHALNVDFIREVGSIVIPEENGQRVIAGGARYVIVISGGIGAALLLHLITIGREEFRH
jgi:hypothetical protein